MTAYSYWEQGRDSDSGKIVSMDPIDLSNSCSYIGGGVLLNGAMMISAIAQFGIYMEMRKLTTIQDAQFEERRHKWLSEIISQWLQEHSSTTGVISDVTVSLCKECLNMWEALENKKVDVPQNLILQIKRIIDFLELNYCLAAMANNSLVEASGSDREFLLNPTINTSDMAMRSLKDIVEETKADWWKGLWKSAAGIPLCMIPGIGPLLGLPAIGYGIGESIKKATFSEEEFSHLHDKIALLQVSYASHSLSFALNNIAYILYQQKFDVPMRFVLAESGSNQISFLLDSPVKGKKLARNFLKPIKTTH